jgi:hypothetical protein
VAWISWSEFRNNLIMQLCTNNVIIRGFLFSKRVLIFINISSILVTFIFSIFTKFPKDHSKRNCTSTNKDERSNHRHNWK